MKFPNRHSVSPHCKVANERTQKFTAHLFILITWVMAIRLLVCQLIFLLLSSVVELISLFTDRSDSQIAKERTQQQSQIQAHTCTQKRQATVADNNR